MCSSDLHSCARSLSDTAGSLLNSGMRSDRTVHAFCSRGVFQLGKTNAVRHLMHFTLEP